MRLDDDSAGDGGGDIAGDEISDGEAIYSVLCGALMGADDGRKSEIAMALLGGLDSAGRPVRAFASLSEEARDLFEAAGEALFDDDEDDGDEGEDDDDEPDEED